MIVTLCGNKKNLDKLDEAKTGSNKDVCGHSSDDICDCPCHHLDSRTIHSGSCCVKCWVCERKVKA